MDGAIVSAAGAGAGIVATAIIGSSLTAVGIAPAAAAVAVSVLAFASCSGSVLSVSVSAVAGDASADVVAAEATAVVIGLSPADVGSGRSVVLSAPVPVVVFASDAADGSFAGSDACAEGTGANVSFVGARSLDHRCHCQLMLLPQIPQLRLRLPLSWPVTLGLGRSPLLLSLDLCLCPLLVLLHLGMHAVCNVVYFQSKLTGLWLFAKDTILIHGQSQLAVSVSGSVHCLNFDPQMLEVHMAC